VGWCPDSALLGEALVDALDRPVAIDSGIITDAVVDLADRKLLIGEPLGTYLVGSPRLYEWANGRAVLDRIEVTHDSCRIRGAPEADRIRSPAYALAAQHRHRRIPP
jgi:hypothetical protein